MVETQTTDPAAQPNPVVPEYEIFKNNNNAVAFFMNRQPSLDTAAEEGPFWFTIHEDKNIIAGSETGQAFFPDVTADVLEISKQRGVILLVEFENQQPVRCTPCYYTDI
jgi:hypothetical protein